MKPLILSFFVVLLGYSLFFDKKEKDSGSNAPEQQVALSRPETMKAEQKADSVELYAKKTNFDLLKLMENDNLFN